uniref:hypothetical protein n=1 Tax=Streptococcus danieliae TaxID=747656 RepID=UPI0026EBA035
GLKSYRRIVNKKGSRVNQLWNLFHILGYSALTKDLGDSKGPVDLLNPSPEIKKKANEPEPKNIKSPQPLDKSI